MIMLKLNLLTDCIFIVDMHVFISACLNLATALMIPGPPYKLSISLKAGGKSEETTFFFLFAQYKAQSRD